MLISKDLVDVEVFTQCRKIEQALLNESVTECLGWWNENKATLSKINVLVRLVYYI
jgi:macrophage erythroblast attacher